ncbi:MAG: 16S rRNA (guanine(527)-N(7))-methyltransferase RsmG [Syntrophomonadaceae bacterium]|nr:16S rRNA (guanine(527)-N(7))-methyltransferase RsmG [Syntrophomonadaceae bacterium]
MEYNVKSFTKLLWRENELHNLVSRKTTPEDLERHIDDSLRLLDFVDLTSGTRLVDIGSGAGFPGLILAMARPEVEVTLVESDAKKSQFLNLVREELGLTRVSVVCRRVEELGRDPQWRESFDYCTSRAVAAINIMLEYGLPLIKTDGRLLLWKGRNYPDEMEKAQNALLTLGGVLEDIFHYTLMEELDRVIIALRKTCSTPDKYPRRVGVPSKRPL